MLKKLLEKSNLNEMKIQMLELENKNQKEEIERLTLNLNSSIDFNLSKNLEVVKAIEYLENLSFDEDIGMKKLFSIKKSLDEIQTLFSEQQEIEQSLFCKSKDLLMNLSLNIGFDNSNLLRILNDYYSSIHNLNRLLIGESKLVERNKQYLSLINMLMDLHSLNKNN